MHCQTKLRESSLRPTCGVIFWESKDSRHDGLPVGDLSTVRVSHLGTVDSHV